MTIEKPWQKFVVALLETMKIHWGGTVSSLDKTSIEEIFVYPEFDCELQGYEVNVTVSEFPKLVKTADAWGAGIDNVEYLRITLRLPHIYDMEITHEDFYKRIGKFLRLEREFQTGNKEFDKKFFVRLKSDRDKELILNHRIQELAQKVEPFTILQIEEKKIHWSQTVEKKEQLTFVKIEPIVLHLVELANVIAAT